jgi:hypothetical protein
MCEGLDCITLGQDRDIFEHSNETGDSINGEEYLDQLSGHQLLEKDVAVYNVITIMIFS